MTQGLHYCFNMGWGAKSSQLMIQKVGQNGRGFSSATVRWTWKSVELRWLHLGTIYGIWVTRVYSCFWESSLNIQHWKCFLEWLLNHSSKITLRNNKILFGKQKSTYWLTELILEWFQYSNIQWLQCMGGMQWEAKEDYIICMHQVD